MLPAGLASPSQQLKETLNKMSKKPISFNINTNISAVVGFLTNENV
jgi:hypothetical protein